MGRKGGGGDGGGGGGGSKGGKGYGQAAQHYGDKGGQEPGAWAPRVQQGGWGQSPPGWPQNTQAQGWGPQEQGWGRPTPTPYGKGGSGGGKGYQGPYANQEPRGRRSNQGVWQGLQDVTGAVRVALDTARDPLAQFAGTGPCPRAVAGDRAERSGARVAGCCSRLAAGGSAGPAAARPPCSPPFPLPPPPDPDTLTTRSCSASPSGLTDRTAKTRTRRTRRWHA